MHQAPGHETILQGARVLVVEDDFLISMELESVLIAAGADVVGPSHTVADALTLVDQTDITVAILDVRLGGDTVAPLARDLTRRKIPFVFYTGQVHNDLFWREWPDSTVVSKPASATTLIGAVAAVSRQA